ncbi:MAG: hypothetical protein NZ772_16690 [Cyanobacteria bacterium]|nr:hypothetical protein [Cyanobacteriota bacterium]MDW8202972.1 hypothetical protein [Cyanobacteriota bacterium SKYGB_h_bin112]
MTPMIQQSDRNPFDTYRDPVTGRWCVVLPAKSDNDDSQPTPPSESSH